MRIKVSIALCTFNGSRYLDEQLNSFERQSVKPDEIVICDDASSDGTVSILSKFAEQSTIPVRLFENTRILGSTKNFENAINQCMGDIILFSDQDDIWYQDKIEKICAMFAANPDAGYVFSDAVLVGPEGDDDRGRLWDAVCFDNTSRELFASGKQVEVLLRRSVVTGATMGFRRTLVPLVCPISRNWVHDGWIALLSSAFGYNGIFLRDPLIAYRQHQSQQIGVKSSSLVNKLEKLSSRENGMLETDRHRFVDVLSRMRERGLNNCPQTAMIEEKICHLLNRIEIVDSVGLRKAVHLAVELSSGRYHKYSNSWYSMAADLFKR